MYGFFEYGMWVIVLKETSEIIGRIGFDNRQVDGEVVPEMGYVIDPAYQNTGIGYECGMAALLYMKESLGIEHINCLMPKDNFRSEMLAKKLGFEYKTTINNYKMYEIFTQFI